MLEQESESYVTAHASKRLRERVGVRKRSIQNISDRALSKGLSHKDLSGKLRRYVDGLFLRSRTANNIKVYSEKIYIFRDNTLITVISLPSEFKKLANKLYQSKKEN